MPSIITNPGKPTRYNLVVAPNVWTLASISAAEDAYILQVLKVDDGGSVVATIQQPANPAGVAHFDVSKILQSQMGISFVEETEKLTNTIGETFKYQIRFGSITDNVPSYDGTSQEYYAYNGYLPWRHKDWISTRFIPDPTPESCLCETPPCFENVSYVGPQRSSYDYLHNYPSNAIPVRSSVWHTLSFFNRVKEWDDGTQWGNNEQPWAVRVKYFDVDSNLIQTGIYVISDATGLGPRTTYTDTTPGPYHSDDWIGTIGAGPENLKAAGLWPQASPAIWNQVVQVWGNFAVIWNLATTVAYVDSYTVEIMSADMCYWQDNGAPAGTGANQLEPYLGDTIYIQEFQVADPCTGYDPVTVSFVNQYGVKDYFTFDRRNTYNQGISRNNYKQVLGTWSAATFTIDPHGRGSRTFSSEIETNMTMSSYWMGDEESAWLEELFTSPHVQVYYEGVWEPAVITSNSYEQKTNVRNGLFQHTLQVQFANNKRVQRG